MKDTNYNDYNPTEVDSFYDDYPSKSQLKSYIRDLFRRKENIEKVKFDLTEWDSYMNYGSLKRNISYLNNQLDNGMLFYTDMKLVLVDENDVVLSDEVISTSIGKVWHLQTGETCSAVPTQAFYWNRGLDVKVIIFEMELYFLTELDNKEMLKYKERIIDKKLIDIVNPNNVFDKKNLDF